MTPKEFWNTLDRLDDMYKRGVIDTTQYGTECVLLGWQWHRKTGEQLPARPRNTVVRCHEHGCANKVIEDSDFCAEHQE